MNHDKDDAEKRVKALIKAKLHEIEQLSAWKSLPPDVTNLIRHVVIRTAFGAYKIGMLVGM